MSGPVRTYRKKRAPKVKGNKIARRQQRFVHNLLAGGSVMQKIVTVWEEKEVARRQRNRKRDHKLRAMLGASAMQQ